MLKGKNAVLLGLFLLSTCGMTNAADSLIVQYVTWSTQALNYFDSLNVYQSGKAELITGRGTTSVMKTYQMTQAEMNNLIALFTNNNYSSFDSAYQSGCLACQAFAIEYGNKRVYGNTTGGSTQLANIKAGLDSLVNKIKNASSVICVNNNSVAARPHQARLQLVNKAGCFHIIARDGKTQGMYSVLGHLVAGSN